MVAKQKLMNKINRILAVLVVLMALIAPALLQNVTAKDRPVQTPTTAWQRFKIEGEFSVLLPFAPAMATVPVTYARNQTRRDRTLATYADGVVFVIQTFEKKGMSFDDLVQRSIGSEATEAVTIDGVSGKSYSSSDETVASTAQFFETSNNLYKFAVSATKLGDHSEPVSKFFSSIKFANSREGRAIVNGPGEQPLSHANDADLDSIVKARELTTRIRVISKPEPQYTEQARMSQTTGTVVLRCIFSKSGAVEQISVVKDLPNGLTDRSIEAARQIRFIPGMKDGHFVSTWMQLEYNFNLY